MKFYKRNDDGLVEFKSEPFSMLWEDDDQHFQKEAKRVADWCRLKFGDEHWEVLTSRTEVNKVLLIDDDDIPNESLPFIIHSGDDVMGCISVNLYEPGSSEKVKLFELHYYCVERERSNQSS